MIGSFADVTVLEIERGDRRGPVEFARLQRSGDVETSGQSEAFAPDERHHDAEIDAGRQLPRIS